MSDPRGIAARDLAWTAAALIAVDPVGIGGIHLRARPGPELDAWFAALHGVRGMRPTRRVPPHVDAGRLTGEVDLIGSLERGRRVARPGLLPEVDGGMLVVPMAERIERETGAVLAEAMDTGRVQPRVPGVSPASARFAAVMIDESREDEAGLPELVQERLGCLVTLEPVGASAPSAPPLRPERVDRARAMLDRVEATDDQLRALVTIAARLGIPSLRPATHALRVARAHAAWRRAEADAAPRTGRIPVTDDDLAIASALVILPRARVAPAAPDALPDEPLPDPPEPADRDSGEDDAPDTGDDGEDQDRIPAPAGELAEQVIEAARAHLPEGLIARFAEARARGAGRKGARLRQLVHGHRVGARPGDPRRGGRVDLPATLRAAAPWQRARRAAAEAAAAADDGDPGPARPVPRVLVRPGDLQVQERVRRTATATVFVVDASGSQALSRLAEVKGAVELFLAESYIRRDQVALVTFRERAATLVVPPTRSLVRVRRLLRGLAGGGGTPLASGLEEALRLALGLQGSEASPRIVLLTDGRPNVTLQGTGGRARAREDALEMARRIAGGGIPMLVLDSSARGETFAVELAKAAAGTVAHLPRPDAEGLRSALDLLEPGSAAARPHVGRGR